MVSAIEPDSLAGVLRVGFQPQAGVVTGPWDKVNNLDIVRIAKLDLNPPHGQVGFRELVGQTDRVHIGFLNFGHHLRHPDGDQ